MNRPANQVGFDLLRRFLEVIVLAVAAQWASFLRFGVPLQKLSPIYVVLLYTCSVLLFFGFPNGGLHASLRGRSLVQVFGRVSLSWGGILTVGVVLSFFLKEAGVASRLWIFYWFCLGLLLLAGFGLAVYYTLRCLRQKYGFNSKRVLIVGYGRTGREMHRRALRQDWFGFDVRAVYAEPDELARGDEAEVFHVARMEDIHAYVLAQHIDEIWITLPIDKSAKMLHLQYLLRKTLVDIRFVPDAFGIQVFSHHMAEFLGVPAVDLNCPQNGGIEALAKEAFDRLFALAALVLLAPLFAVVAIAIKCSSPGPVFYRQERHGLNGRTFMIYKFRSMKIHQEADSGTVTQATRHDSRITAIGHFIRRTSIDELPQFINVLKGEMSVVGPRPHAVQHNELYGELLEGYMQRHRVKPGITGWAQIHGLRGETDTVEKMAARVKFDIQYIQDWCFWLDLKIILWTALKGWTGNNAY
ncbi:MAG TPA: undecaprenyl-phosphate glucose phosphotransferase [Noviherbaspirillum sp.]|nr:undecaprenyl-phosphate glucose phosphotransferase [Noviherbaspirillum sp.]